MSLRKNASPKATAEYFCKKANRYRNIWLKSSRFKREAKYGDWTNEDEYRHNQEWELFWDAREAAVNFCRLAGITVPKELQD